MVLFGAPAPVLADVAPPEMPPGSNPVPGEEQTQVQMLAETVILEVQPNPYPRGEEYKDWNLVDDWAMVTATFTMRNQGNQAETMEARFPLMKPNGWGDGWFNYPEITNFRVFVENKQVNWKRITTENKATKDAPPIAWAAFEVTFPPGKDVLIMVKYDSRASGYPPFSEFRYILETGAGWKDAIGSADIILRLPYPASAENAALPYSTEGGEYSGNEVRWHFENLEPTMEDNIRIQIVQVTVWQEVLNAQKTLKDNPNSGEAWGRLGRAYKMAILYPKGYLRDDEAGISLYEQSAAAYQEALELSPKTARWHAGYAELMWASVAWSSAPNYPFIEQIVRELDTALKLDPQNEQAINLLWSINNWMPEVVQLNEDESFTMLILTATIPYSSPTPVFTEKPVLTATAPPTETPPPTATQTATTAPTLTSSAEIEAAATALPATATASPAESAATEELKKSSRLPICGSLLAIPAVIFLSILSKYRLVKSEL